MPFAQLNLLRHGQSVWNQQNKFTGWEDVALCARGVEEAKAAAERMRDEQININCVFTSCLRRAIATAWIVLDELNLMWLPQQADWRLNERHYGALQGKNKAEVAAQHGEEQVRQWRRSYNTPPPPLTEPMRNPPACYAGVQIPTSESLQMIIPRVQAVYEQRIIPQLQARQNVLIVAHGNTIRALVKILENTSDNDIMNVEIKTAQRLRYDFDSHLTPTPRP